MINFFDAPTSDFIEIKLRIDREHGHRTLSVARPRDGGFFWQTVSWDGSGQLVLHPSAGRDFVEKVDGLAEDIKFAYVGNSERYTWDADGEPIEHPATEVTFTKVGRKTKLHYLVLTRAELVAAAEQIDGLLDRAIDEADEAESENLHTVRGLDLTIAADPHTRELALTDQDGDSLTLAKTEAVGLYQQLAQGEDTPAQRENVTLGGGWVLSGATGSGKSLFISELRFMLGQLDSLNASEAHQL